MRAGVALLVMVAVSGCSSVPLYPLAPSYTTEEVIAKGKPVSSLSLAQARQLVDGWRQVYVSEASARRNGHTLFGEGMFIGSILAVAGALFDKTGLLNSGAGLAGLSATAQGHYVLNTQAVAFERAARRMECLGNALMPLDPADELTVQPPTEELKTTLLVLPAKVLKHTQKTRDDLQSALNAIELPAANREDIVAAVDKWRAAKTTAAQTQPAPAAVPRSAAQLQREQRFLKALATVEAEMDLCMQENRA